LPSERPDHFIAFDYLVDQPGLDLIPPITWQTLLATVEPRQLFRIGDAAARRFQHGVAAQAFRRAASRGVAGADTAAEFYAAYADQLTTNNAFERLVEAREEQLGRTHPETLHARLMLAESLADSPHAAKSLDVFPELIDDLRETFGEKHQHTLDAQRWHAYAIGTCGNVELAMNLLHRTSGTHEETFGPSHISTLLVQHYLAFFTAEDDPCGALDMLDSMQETYSRVYGPDSPRVLQIRDLKGTVMRRSEIPLATTLAHQQALLCDRSRIIGPDHAHTLGTRYQIISTLTAMGQYESARALLDELLHDWVGDSAEPAELQKITLRITGLRLQVDGVNFRDDGRQLPSTRISAINAVRVVSFLRGEDDPLTRQILEVVTAAGVSLDSSD
jgi:hypothetical protein